MSDIYLGGNTEIGNTEIGGNVEIGAVEVCRVIEHARDSRQPAPRMRAVPEDAPIDPDGATSDLADIFIGVAEATGENKFPLSSRLLQRFGGVAREPFHVRVDTAETFPAFRAESSPEFAEFRERLSMLDDRVAALRDQLREHMADPDAHDALLEEVDNVDALGAEVAASEAEKQVNLWLPPDLEENVRAWREDQLVCASILLPGADGELRICTAMEPMERGIAEMSHYAAGAGVDGAAVVGALPAMGVVLGAGTLVKKMAAAASSILRRPEARGKKPFIVRIEPETSPALATLATLALGCRRGVPEAQEEWRQLALAVQAAGVETVARAMEEACVIAKKEEAAA